MIYACVRVWRERPRLIPFLASLWLIAYPASIEIYLKYRPAGISVTARTGMTGWLEHVLFSDLPLIEAATGAMYVAGIGLALITLWYKIRRPVTHPNRRAPSPVTPPTAD